jgi:hypothetical protein
MYGTLYGALEARKIEPSTNDFKADIEGRIEAPAGKTLLQITAIHVHYEFPIPAGKRVEAERALAVHAEGCEAYMSVKDCIKITWDADMRER